MFLPLSYLRLNEFEPSFMFFSKAATPWINASYQICSSLSTLALANTQTDWQRILVSKVGRRYKFLPQSKLQWISHRRGRRPLHSASGCGQYP